MGAEVNIRLRIEEVNQIMTFLGKQPYESVYLLIDKIRQEATQQLQLQNAPTETVDKYEH